MKTTSILLTAAFVTLSAATAFAQQAPADKDECLLASKNCVDQVDDIYKRMHRLDKEIQKGNKVYTATELKKLKSKLAETQELLRDMEKPGH